MSSICSRVGRLLVLWLSVPASIPPPPPPPLPRLMQAQLAPQWQTTGRLKAFLLRVASCLRCHNRWFFRAVAWSCSSTELDRRSSSGGGGVDEWSSWGCTNMSPSRGLGWKSRISEVCKALGGEGVSFRFQNRDANNFIFLDFSRRRILPCFNLRIKRNLIVERGLMVALGAARRE